jgi:CRISPR-associated protein Csb1
MVDANAVPLTLKKLTDLVSGGAVAIRGRAILEPAGGPGDKVFPPSHMVDKNARDAGARYASEQRVIDGAATQCVLLDSVQSQANRMEDALQALWADKRISLPVIVVDFTKVAPDIGKVTSLSAPHRVADALLRDSLLEGKLFRLSELGKSFTDATLKNAAPLFRVCPTGLVFGIWDSTGPKGGLGSKFARALVSEIVGVGSVNGVKTASRIDPTGIVKKAADVLQALDPNEGWTHDPALAAKDTKGNVLKKGDGKVSEVNHSNVPPTLDWLGGGVTIEYALHNVVVSIAALRKLSFGGDDTAVRAVLVALSLLAILAAEDRGHDLRSRCLLIPRKGHGLALEAVARDGSTEALAIDLKSAIALYNDAVKALPETLRFKAGPGEALASLTPSPKLVHLVQKSRELAATGDLVEDE